MIYLNKKKGSAILIVIILALAASAYVGSCISLKNSYKVTVDKYDKIINDYYSKDLENLPDLYNKLDKINK